MVSSWFLVASLLAVYYLQRCRIAESLAEVALDLVFGREIELFEEFGRDIDATGSANLAERVSMLFLRTKVIRVQTLTGTGGLRVAAIVMVGEVLLERHIVA